MKVKIWDSRAHAAKILMPIKIGARKYPNSSPWRETSIFTFKMGRWDKFFFANILGHLRKQQTVTLELSTRLYETFNLNNWNCRLTHARMTQPILFNCIHRLLYHSILLWWSPFDFFKRRRVYDSALVVQDGLHNVTLATYFLFSNRLTTRCRPTKRSESHSTFFFYMTPF